MSANININKLTLITSIVLSSSILLYSLKKYFENKANETIITIDKLIVYPIKTCGGIHLKKVKLTQYGFENDRRWMITKDNRQVTQKLCPTLATVETSYSDDGKYLIVSKVGIEKQLHIPTAPLDINEIDESKITTVTMTLDSVQCYDQGDEAAEWFSMVMNDNSGTIRLVTMVPPSIWNRSIRKHIGENLNPSNPEQYKASLTNSCQVLLVSNSSINAVNDKIDETRVKLGEKPQPPLPYDRYRANILLNGTNEFQEDNWKSIEIGDQQIEFKMGDANARCPIVTIDQTTGTLDPTNDDEPLRTLKTFRNVQCKVGEKSLLGMYVVISNENHYNKTIKVGDKIHIKNVGFTSNYYTKINN